MSSRAAERRRRALVYRRRRIVVALVAWVWTLFGGAGQNPAPSSEPRKTASSTRSSTDSRNRDSPKDDEFASRQREREEEPSQENGTTTPAPDDSLDDGGRQAMIAQAEQTAQANGKQVVRYTYCVASMGASVDMNQFENKVFHTLNDPKGWPRAGATFSRADQAAGQACDMTITLAEAQYLPSFSEGCSVEWPRPLPQSRTASASPCRKRSATTKPFLNEFFGTLILVLGALCCLMLPWGAKDPAAAAIVVGFIVWGLVSSMGGPTGPGLNPARDLMPRLLHQLLPIAHKGSSRWREAWIPVVAPIVGAMVGAFLFKTLFAAS